MVASAERGMTIDEGVGVIDLSGRIKPSSAKPPMHALIRGILYS